MNAPDRYTLMETLREGTRFVVHRGIRNEDGCPVVLKVPRSHHLDRRDVACLRHELEIGRRLSDRCAIRPCALTLHHARPALVLEAFRGRSLDELLGAPMDLGRFLRIAARVSTALADIHAEGIVHKDINPRNIIVDTESGEVRITDFALASVLPEDPEEQSDGWCPSAIEGSLGYISPEQTGRMNRAIDHRTDLYSLGVTLYEMLTGVLPFSAGDALEWVYCHLAVVPQPPAELVPGLPRTVSEIVMKLLAKAAEDRYQSARGLAQDLERCLDRLEASCDIAPFPLGEHDFSGRFQIPKKLYGRERDAHALFAAFERVVESGAPEILLISGHSGVGKSSLVRELYRPIVRERGLFAEGKFDQQHRRAPYSTLIQALRDLVLGIVDRGDPAIVAWRSHLAAALGRNAQLIIDVIPEVELILGKQPHVPELPLTETQRRLAMVFRQFLGAFCRREHPCCLFLDDLQWADPESLAVLEHMVTHPETHYLLTLGAYRDNEVDPSHPLSLMQGRARDAGASIHVLELSPLSGEHVQRLVADAVQQRLDDAAPLARLVHEKTDGNPLFVTQFLTMLHKEGLIEVDPRAGAFTWDIDAIRGKGFADNVVDLMITKIKRLSRTAQEALTLAACVGNTVDAGTLAVIRDRRVDAIHEDHRELVREGLLLRSGDTYRFLHDRVQQAAYALVPEGERPAMHLRIGRLLYAHAPPEASDARIFEITDHLNLGSALVADQQERNRLARLNLTAGRRAEASAAYAAAAGYLAAGTALLSDDAWETEYALARDLCCAGARCAFLNGDLAAAERLIDALKQRARSRLDLAEAHRVEIELHTARADFERAARSALAYARGCGIDLPLHPARDEAELEVREVWREVSARGVESLAHLPRMGDPEAKAVMTILSAALPSAYYGASVLCDLIACQMVRISLRSGNSDTSACGYVAFGATLGRLLGLYRESYRFADLARALLDTADRTASGAQVLHMIAILIDPWIRPWRDVVGLLHRAFEEAVATGALAHAAYSSFQIVALRFASGDPLADVAAEAERRMAFTRHIRCDAIHDSVAFVYRLVQRLRGAEPGWAPPDASDAPRERCDPERADDALCGAKAPPTWFYERLYRAEEELMFGRYDGAVAAAHSAGELLGTVTGQRLVAEHCYVAALALSGHSRASPPEHRRELLSVLREHEAKLQGWAEVQPANLADRVALVSAEIARVEGDDLAAMRLYEQAIRAARENGSLQSEAMSHELAAQFYRDRGFDMIADTYLRAARSCYARWGAGGKVKQLDRLFPHLATRPLASTATVTVPAEELDRLAVVKASQSISGEILIPRLEEALLRVVLEYSGAQKGYLLEVDRRAATIRAKARIEGGKAFAEALAGEARAPVSAAVMPLSIVNHVQRTGEAVILDDAAETRFSADEYIALVRPKSVLCMPITRRSGRDALLYLENASIRGAFTEDALAVLKLLSSQAAVSLENASLYAELQKSEEVLQSIIDSSPAIIYVKDLEGRLRLINRQYEQLVRLPRAQVIGKNDHEIYPPEMADTFAAYDRKAIEADRPMDLEEVVALDDEPRTYLSLKFTLHDAAGAVYAVCGISTDITERKRAEMAERFLAEACKRLAADLGYEATLDAIAEVAVPELAEGATLYVLDDAGALQPAAVAADSPARAARLRELAAPAGASAASPGTPGDPHRVLSADRAELCRVDDGLMRRWAAGAARPEALFELAPAAYLNAPLVTRGRCLGVLSLMRTRATPRYTRADVPLVEELARRAAMALDSARLYREAQQAVQLREEFLSVASHELRTPLTPLKLKLSRLQKALATESANPSLERMVAASLGQVARLEVLIDSLLDVAQFARSGLDLELADVDLSALTRDVVGGLAESSSRAGCRIELDARRPVLGRFDRLRVEQALRSLLNNAIKFGPGRPIEVTVSERGDTARIVVRDHGIGIAPEDLERIFKRFERAVSSRSYGGLGLGLHIANEIVRAHGGTIQVSSQKGEGACFTVDLPRREAS